nr:class II fructose-bisphosphate aldolase [Candidatus Sigynarchaeota archaeon]
MQKYKELGFVNTNKIYEKALKHHYAIPGYNFNTLEQVIAITQACVKTSSPVLLQYYAMPAEMLPLSMVVHVAKGAVAMAADMGNPVEMALHLDHGHSFEQCKMVIDAGFSSVMIDGSTLPFEKNVDITRKVVQYAHERDVTVEGELGKISGGQDVHGRIEQQYTRPDEAKSFVDATGIDSLAVSVGTVHGAFKFALKPGEVPPPLRFDILEQIKKLMPDMPIVLHGASSVPKEYVALINA